MCNLERLLIEDTIVMDRLESMQNELENLTISAKQRAETAKSVGSVEIFCELKTRLYLF